MSCAALVLCVLSRKTCNDVEYENYVCLISLVTNKEIGRDKVRSSLLAINFYCQVVAPKGAVCNVRLSEPS